MKKSTQQPGDPVHLWQSTTPSLLQTEISQIRHKYYQIHQLVSDRINQPPTTLTNRTPSCIIIFRVSKLVKTVGFFGQPYTIKHAQFDLNAMAMRHWLQTFQFTLLTYW